METSRLRLEHEASRSGAPPRWPPGSCCPRAPAARRKPEPRSCGLGLKENSGSRRNRRNAMTQPTAPIPIGQYIGEAEGALTALLEGALRGTDLTRTGYITLQVLAQRGPFGPPGGPQQVLPRR